VTFYSLERVQAYIDIEHEPKPTSEGNPPAAWPTSGDLLVEKLSARYSPVGCIELHRPDFLSEVHMRSQSGPKVLHDISFHIKSGERIGVGKCFCQCCLCGLTNLP